MLPWYIPLRHIARLEENQLWEIGELVTIVIILKFPPFFFFFFQQKNNSIIILFCLPFSTHFVIEPLSVISRFVNKIKCSLTLTEIIDFRSTIWRTIWIIFSDSSRGFDWSTWKRLKIRAVAWNLIKWLACSCL